MGTSAGELIQLRRCSSGSRDRLAMIQPPIWGNLRTPWEIAYVKSFVESSTGCEVRTFDMGPETLPLVEAFARDVRRRVADDFETECYLSSLAFLTSIAESYLIRLFHEEEERREPLRALLATKTHHRGDSLDRLVDLFIEAPFFAQLDERIESLCRRIADEGFEWVGVTTHITSYGIALHLAKVAKRIAPRIRTALSGYQATISAEQTLATCPWVDVVIRGESEGGYAAVLSEGVEGRAVVDRRTSPLDVDAMPTPDYRDLDLSQYKMMSIMASRNCPYGKCEFCQEEAFWSTFRHRSARALLRDMEVQYDRHGVSRFDFVDLDIRDFVVDLSAAMAAGGHGFRWSGAMRADKNTPSVLASMARTRCKGMFFGFESGSRRLLAKMRKNITPDTLEATLRAARDAGVRSKLTCITGLPTETEDDFRATLDLVERNKSDIRLVLVQCFKVLSRSPIGDALDDPENDYGLSRARVPELARVEPLLYALHYRGQPSPETAVERFVRARRAFRELGVDERAVLLSTNRRHQPHTLGLR